jgi:hypothetical protein
MPRIIKCDNKQESSIASRNFKMVEMLVNESATLQVISNYFNMSRQRVQQILKKELEPEQYKVLMGTSRENKKKKKKENIPVWNCKYCKIEIRSTVERIFCNRECKKKFLNTPERVAERKRKRRMRQRECSKIWNSKNKDKIREYARKSYEKRKAAGLIKYTYNPERGKIYNHRHFQKIKEDPVRYAHYIEHQRQYNKERYEKLKNGSPEEYEKFKQEMNARNKERYAKIKELRKKYDPAYRERNTTIIFTNTFNS